MSALEKLEAWLSEEGVETGARSVRHMEYDCNWREPFMVRLREYPDKEFIGGGPNLPGGLALAIEEALAKARR